MFVVNDDLSIYATRGDIVCLNVSATDDLTGEAYEFQPGDIVRMKIFAKKNAEDVVMQKDFPVVSPVAAVSIMLTEADTKFGGIISKPTDYWYEIELNPYSNPQTIVGYDEDGAKIFKLFPEGKDLKDEPTKPEDIPVVDEDLDLTSSRPVENRAISRAVTLLKNDLEVTNKRIQENKNAGNELAKALEAEKTRFDNLIAADNDSLSQDLAYIESIKEETKAKVDGHISSDGVFGTIKVNWREANQVYTTLDLFVVPKECRPMEVGTIHTERGMAYSIKYDGARYYLSCSVSGVSVAPTEAGTVTFTYALGNYELKDIRLGADGIAYATAGEAVRAQISGKIGKLPVGRSAERLVHGDIVVDTTSGVIKCVPHGNSKPYLYANNAYWFVQEFENNELDYLSIVSEYGDDASWAYVADTVNKTFALRRVVEDRAMEVLSTDIIIFVCLFSPDGVATNDPICYCNSIYFDGILQLDLTNMILPWNKIIGSTTGKVEIDTAAQTITASGLFFFETGKWANIAANSIEFTSYAIHSGGETVRLILNAEGKLELRHIEDACRHGDVLVCLIFASGTWAFNKDKIYATDEAKKVIFLDGESVLGDVDALRNSVSAIEKDLSDVKSELSDTEIAMRRNKQTCKIFKRVCCCGDSYTSGHMSVNGVTAITNEEFAWPHFMSTMTGNEWVNCGASGANVLTWQTKERGLPKAISTGKVQAYIIGLMLNDTASGTDRYVELGTVNDIGTEAKTYYGGMSAIVRKLNAISPNAKIFIQTCPRGESKFAPYNQAVLDIVAAYKGTYNVHCLDLRKYAEMYAMESITKDEIGGHFTAIGYEQFAEILALAMSNYINENIKDFQDVHMIEYDTHEIGAFVENGVLCLDETVRSTT
jgi:hypothetical protein